MREYFRKLWLLLSRPSALRIEDEIGDIMTIKLNNAGTVRLEVNFDMTKATKTDREFLNDLIEKMQKRQP